MTQIVVLDPEALLAFTGTGATLGVDLSDFDPDADFISIACPEFPLSDIDIETSYVDFTSGENGDFDTGPTDSIAFDESTIPLVEGDSEFRFALSLLDSVDLSSITGVRFRIEATDTCTFRASAIRCVSADWVYAPIDSNTLYERAGRPVPPNGALYAPYDFPSSTTDWPVLYKADEPTSSKDPMPIDLTVGVAFKSGSLFAATGDRDYAFTMTNTDSVSVPDDAALDFSGSFTLEAWIKPTSTSGSRTIIKKWTASSGERGYQLSFDATGNLVFEWTTDGNTVQTATSDTADVELDEWNHVAVTFQKPGSGSTIIRLYHNGVEVGSDSVSNQAVAATTQPLVFGGFNGSLDEVAVYPSALAASRILQHFQTAKAIPGRYYDEVLLDTPEGYWRLDEASGDPAVVDSANSHDGSRTVTTHRANGALGLSASADASENSISLFFRQVPLDLQTQLDIDGLLMADLDAAGVQPDYDQAKYTNRTQADLNVETQSTLDGDTQFDLARLPDYVSNYYIEVKLGWYDGDAYVTVQNSNGDGQTFDGFSLSSNGHYYMIAELENDGIRVRIYTIDEAGNFGTPDSYGKVFDSTLMVDDVMLKRRKGRFGWYTRFADGDAYIQRIQPRAQSYGEVVTKGFQSNTPVDGAQLQVSGSSDRELFTHISASPWGGTTVTTNRDKAPSGDGFEIITSAGRPHQGIQTNTFTIDDFGHTEIKFDLFFPDISYPGSDLEAFLYGENARIVPLTLGGFVPNKWNPVRFFLKNDLLQTGSYRFMVIQSLPSLNTTWYIDRLSIIARSLEWSGRANRPDAWNMSGDGWTEFKNTVNTIDGGAIFQGRGKEVQIRGKALRQNSFITEVKTLPKYSELGRLYWPDEHPEPAATAPTAAFTSTTSGNTAEFDGSSSSNVGGTNVSWYWSFGDGHYDFGEAVSHHYEDAGTYTVTLTVVDDQGRQDAINDTVTIV